MFINCPEYINTAFRLLEKNGFNAYVVGGCVRDSLCGKEPCDWDMTTSSTPQETMEVFKDFRVIPTGLKHGTVTVIIDGIHIEITTMRVDGEYYDNRRPESVHFTTEIEQDLSRRDFTVNAMAYNHKDGLIDIFGGKEDLKNRIIRCVGAPDIRFNEDALRIIRALRFASVLDFKIEKTTSESIQKNIPLINNVAKERIRVELVKLLCGTAVERILTDYKEIIFSIIPELRRLDEFPQNTPYHIYDVWTHTVKVVSSIKNDEKLRVAALLHDVAKPFCHTIDNNGVSHFKGHPEKSAQMAEIILRNLRFSNTFINTVYDLILLHDMYPDGNKNTVAHFCSKYTPETIKLTLELMRADSAGKNPEFALKQLASYDIAEIQIDEIVASGLCLKLSDLNVSGHDIKAAGFDGKEIGTVLDSLLELVIEGKISNQKEMLLNAAKKIKNN